MKLYKLLSLNFLATIGVICFIILISAYIIEAYFPLLLKKYTLLYNAFDIYLYFILLDIISLIGFPLEVFFIRKHKRLFIKINIKNYIIKKIYIFSFYIGLFVSLFNIIISIILFNI